MPRKARFSVADMYCHVINRGDNCGEVVHKYRDYQRFMEMIGEAVERQPMRILAWSDGLGIGGRY